MLLENKYEIVQKLNSGSFGNIYIGRHLHSREKTAVKLDYNVNPELLINESKILWALQNITGIPKMRACGQISSTNYIVMDLLEYSILDIIESGNFKFSNNNFILLTHQLISCIKHIHSKGIVHRDIKPENIMTKNNKVYLIDFGLSTYYKRNGIHVQEKKGCRIIGTTKYASINVHNGKTYSRRDDIESLMYVFLYMLTGELPWQYVNESSADKQNDKMIKIKESVDFSNYYNMPHDSGVFKAISLSRLTPFSTIPDYDNLKKVLEAL